MFTGLVEELGKVKTLELLQDSAKLTIEADKVLNQAQIGDSIAVNGVCLTVTEMNQKYFSVDIMHETLAKTNLHELKSLSKVNLERALQLSTRLGGHMVSGHVDGIGTISSIDNKGIAKVFKISAPPSLTSFLIPKGSVAIDGISLTVVEVEKDYFTISLIPHTFGHTTLGFKSIGSTVNLETDIIGKYVARFMNMGQETKNKDISMDFLAEHGFI
ncbi:MAG: riboflavin synthase subunit alpha [Gracilibacter sp. BRH_c7a]|nr:MAG: riboflavin synthase subunit alpha [Gracilibacter sp. BRH_c7a]